MEYPKTLYKNVLLLDGKIINWKISTTLWSSVDRAFCSRQPTKLFKLDHERFSVSSIKAKVNNTEENNLFFLDKEWFKRFPIHEDYSVCMKKPY